MTCLGSVVMHKMCLSSMLSSVGHTQGESSTSLAVLAGCQAALTAAAAMRLLSHVTAQGNCQSDKPAFLSAAMQLLSRQYSQIMPLCKRSVVASASFAAFCMLFTHTFTATSSTSSPGNFVEQVVT
jgi:hypothetical protein